MFSEKLHKISDLALQAAAELKKEIDDIKSEIHKPKRLIWLRVVGVHFVQPDNKGTNMSDTFSVELPQGQIARLLFSPVDDKGAVAKLDGPITALVQGDPASAQVAVSPDGLTLDIQLPDVADSLATVEVDGDADLSPTTNVITTIVTARRLGAAVGPAVTLGAKPENVTNLPADQFGVFPTAPAAPTAKSKK